MAQDNQSLPQGAGTTTADTASNRTTGTASTGTTPSAGTTTSTGSSTAAMSPPSGYGSSSAAGSVSFSTDEHESGHRSSGRAVVLAERQSSGPSAAAVVGAAVAGALVGAAVPFMFAGRASSSSPRRSGGSEETHVEESVVINRPARELYDFWRNFENLPQFMDNIESVRSLGGDGRRSHWVIKAPAGTSVEFDSFVTEDVPGKLIAWRSEENASVPNRGRVEFRESSSGSTVVRATINYQPPAGTAGRLVAKLFQREPSVQARQDLNNLKRLMESRG